MKQDIEKYALHWKRLVARPPDYSLASRDPSRFRTVAAWLPKDLNTPILDVGCGWGHLLLGLWGAGYRNLAGVELRNDQYGVARASLPPEIRVIHADARDFLKNTKERFGMVTAAHLIEHLSKEEGLDLLRLAFHILEAPGSVVIITPNMANLFAAYFRYIDLTHVVGYTEWSLFQLLDLAGFVDHKVIGPIVDLRYWRWYAPWRGFALRERLVASIHSLLYRAMGLPVRPRALGHDLIVQSFKK